MKQNKANILCTALLCAVFSPVAMAQMPIDSAKPVQYAAQAVRPAGTITITKEATVVFPTILVQHQEEATDYIETFSNKRRDYLLRTYKKGARLFAKTIKILNKYNLPQELKVLLALESGFNGNAVSGAGAVGYWQFMDETAKQYGLRIVPQPTKEEKARLAKNPLSPDSAKALKKLHAKDERRNFGRSTTAAARYLKDRSRNLNNDWLLVVASYNCGVGNVWDAMAKTGKANPSFWDVKPYLPAETRAYVMNFITLNVIFANYEKFAAGKLTFKPTEVKVPASEQEMIEAIAEPGKMNK